MEISCSSRMGLATVHPNRSLPFVTPPLTLPIKGGQSSEQASKAEL